MVDIKDKPKYCFAWVSKFPGAEPMCNTIPCCAWWINGKARSKDSYIRNYEEMHGKGSYTDKLKQFT